MSTLTRRRSDNSHQETWYVFYDDVRVGTIGKRSGVPMHVDHWGWSCGFYPGLEPGQYKSGSAGTFDAARAAFCEAWDRLLPQIPDGAFDEYRRDRAFHRWKGRMWAEGKPLPTQLASGRSECFCGAPIDIETSWRHIYDKHMEARQP
jgi:hypothetical protein